jgi:hypothetical protein
VTKYDLSAKSTFEATDDRINPAFASAAQENAVASDQVVVNWPLIPWPRGPLSAAVIEALQREPGTLGPMPDVTVADPLADDDFQLALYLCYEVQYRDLIGADWECDVDLLAFRAKLEGAFEAQLREEISQRHVREPFDVATELDQLILASRRESISTYFSGRGTLDQFREFCVHRSASHLREGDPHAFAIPHLSGDAKAAPIQIQSDDNGSGDSLHTYSALFATTMSALGLDASYGSYVEVTPGVTLATVNLVSMFAMHRKWRAALVGQLAVMEMTSVGSMQRYSRALERFGIGAEGRRFDDVHVDVDMHHAEVARGRLVTGLLSADPELGSEVLFGAAAMLLLEENFSRHVLTAWSQERSSLVPWEMNS